MGLQQFSAGAATHPKDLVRVEAVSVQPCCATRLQQGALQGP